MRIISAAGGTSASKLTNLVIIGVPDSYEGKAPSKGAFPRKYNANTKDTWTSMFDDEVVAAALRAAKTIDDKWRMALAEFVSRCTKAGLSPFPSATDTDRTNNRISSLLARQRGELSRVMDATDILNHFRLTNLTRKVVHVGSGFAITSTTDLVPLKSGDYQDSAVLIDELCNNTNRFSPRGNNEFRRDIYNGLYITIKLGKGVWKFSYTVSSTEHPIILKKRPVTDSEYQRFVIHELWLPAVRKYQFTTLNNKRSLV